MNRGYYASHNLTMAKHPSETDLRLMLRIVAFALYADEQLTFGKGLSSEDEPDLWQINYNSTIDRWIDLGQPSDKRLRRACGKAKEVVVFNYDQRAADKWWQQEQSKLSRFSNLSTYQVGPAEALAELEQMAGRSMQLNATIQDGEVWLADNERSVTLVIEKRGG